ncbi:MAG: hypothetical protein AAB550_01480, partial [Patescibacteria group bacterium]
MEQFTQTLPKCVVVICGPTATGKTKLALRLANEFNGELISADSQQIYLGRDAETGKDKDIIGQSKVWLMDVLKPGEEFSVSLWRKLAHEAIADILSRGKLPIVVGGSGLYIRALVENLPNVDVQQNLDLRNSNKSIPELFDILNNIDSVKAKSLNDSDKRNPRRLIRAIEIAQSPSPKLGEGLGVRYLQIGLTAPKEFLIERIKQRVKERGLSEEFVKKEIEIAKKQLVWFKKQKDIAWFDIMKYASENRDFVQDN